MKLIGRIVKDGKVIRETYIEKEEANTSFRDLLEEGLLGLCGALDIPVPLWLKKNTKEFGAFRRTFFSQEQFVEKVKFDRFELRVE